MTEDHIDKVLTSVFRQVLEDDTIELTSATTADDIDGWDSMNHIFIVVELEKRLSIKFQAAEMEELKNIGELSVLIKQKLAKSA